MLYKIFITIAIFCSITASASACFLRSMGNLNLSNASQYCLKHLGNVDLEKVTITKNLDIIGSLDAKDVSLNNFKLVGDAVFSGKNNISENVKIVGDLEANNTNFENKIIINPYEIELKNKTTTKDILVRKNDDSTTNTQYLYIDNSIVNGNIHFESGKGRVILSNGGKYTGTITGGVVENK